MCVSNRLTVDGRLSVCVSRAGPSDWDPFIHIPAGFMETLVNPKINYCWRQHRVSGLVAGWWQCLEAKHLEAQVL